MSEPILYVSDPDFTLWHGDVLDVLRTMPDDSVDCCVTSPPYWGLRDYGIDGQIGLEASPAEFVQRMIDVFRQVRRVLAPHGTCWVNLGDSYNNAGSSRNGEGLDASRRGGATGADGALGYKSRDNRHALKASGIKHKDLVGIPWRVAFALQDDGWWLRSDIIWAKPNPMPESVTDRPTKAHEYVFLLTKQTRYWFDQEAVREPHMTSSLARYEYGGAGANGKPYAMQQSPRGNETGRNVRSVWEIATQPYAEAHFATFPQELPRRCISAGCPEWVCRTCGKARERIVERVDTGRTQKMADGWDTGSGGHGTVHRNGREKGQTDVPVTAPVTLGWSDCGHNNYRAGVVLDPFMGSGTVALVARNLGRHSIGIELNPEYANLCARRLQQLSLLA